MTGWTHREHKGTSESLVEENRVLREQLGNRRLRLNDGQRRRLAAKGKALGRRALRQVATIVTPDTILRWHRRLIAAKWTHTSAPRKGRTGVLREINALTDAVDGFLLGHRDLVCDRDAKFTARFRSLLDRSGIETVLTPYRAPDCNAFAERFVRSIRSERGLAMGPYGHAHRVGERPSPTGW